MTTTGRTLAEVQAWLDTWNENHATPSANSVVDFLGIELAPEPTPPAGQRRRSPSGVEVVKTDDDDSLAWRQYRRGSSPDSSPGSWFGDDEVADWEVADWEVADFWFGDDEVADWEVITDSPEVPEDIIEAAILTLRADDHEQRERGFPNYRTNAKALGRAGLLAGTMPEAPECEREHMPEGHVSIDLSGWADDDLSVAARVVGSGALGASLRAELARRGES